MTREKAKTGKIIKLEEICTRYQHKQKREQQHLRAALWRSSSIWKIKQRKTSSCDRKKNWKLVSFATLWGWFLRSRVHRCVCLYRYKLSVDNTRYDYWLSLPVYATSKDVTCRTRPRRGNIVIRTKYAWKKTMEYIVFSVYDGSWVLRAPVSALWRALDVSKASVVEELGRSEGPIYQTLLGRSTRRAVLRSAHTDLTFRKRTMIRITYKVPLREVPRGVAQGRNEYHTACCCTPDRIIGVSMWAY